MLVKYVFWFLQVNEANKWFSSSETCPLIFTSENCLLLIQRPNLNLVCRPKLILNGLSYLGYKACYGQSHCN